MSGYDLILTRNMYELLPVGQGECRPYHRADGGGPLEHDGFAIEGSLHLRKICFVRNLKQLLAKRKYYLPPTTPPVQECKKPIANMAEVSKDRSGGLQMAAL